MKKNLFDFGKKYHGSFPLSVIPSSEPHIYNSCVFVFFSPTQDEVNNLHLQIALNLLNNWRWVHSLKIKLRHLYLYIEMNKHVFKCLGYWIQIININWLSPRLKRNSLFIAALIVLQTQNWSDKMKQQLQEENPVIFIQTHCKHEL